MIRNYYGPPILPKPSRRIQFIIISSFFVGLFALIAETGLFERTFIPLKTSITIWTVFATIGFAIYVRLFWKHYSAFNALLLSVFYGYAVAGFPLYIFMATNYYCADNKITPQTFKVISAEVGGPKYPPNVVIAYQQTTKKITYDWGTPVGKYKSVTLPIKEGFWGFNIVYQEDITVGLPAQ